jgi:hypothetical protein
MPTTLPAVTAPTTITAAGITRLLRRAGFELTRASTITLGVVKVEQQYTARGALAPADLVSRREARAKLIAEQLIAEGYRAVRVHDRVTVTLPC